MDSWVNLLVAPDVQIIKFGIDRTDIRLKFLDVS